MDVTDHMRRLCLSVQRTLDGDDTILTNSEETARVGGSVYREGHFALAALVQVLGSERLQDCPHAGVLLHLHGVLDAVDLRGVVVDVSKLHRDPRTRRVVRVIRRVLAL